MSNFSERLKKLREEKGFSKTQLSKEVGFPEPSISRWERGLQIPNIETLIVFVKYFKVSADYLLGLEDY